MSSEGSVLTLRESQARCLGARAGLCATCSRTPLRRKDKGSVQSLA